MALNFVNNARATLTGTLGASATNVLKSSLDGWESLSVPESGAFGLLVTITSPAEPGEMEIIRITAASGTAIYMARGLEGTTAREWLTGAILEARITAGALNSFLSMGIDGEGSFEPGELANYRWLVGAKTGYPALSMVTRTTGFPVLEVRDWAGQSPQDQNPSPSREIVNGSVVVGLGTIPAWASSTTYVPGSVVQPTTPNGYQYSVGDVYDTTVGTVQPDFSASMPNSTSEYISGNLTRIWVPTPIPAVVAVTLAGSSDFSGLDPAGFVVTEVGAICFSLESEATTPVVSIGTQADQTRFADSVALDQITAAGHIHRIAVTAGGAPVEDLVFTVETPSDKQYMGRFYWKGFYVQNALITP
ncbi:hypothetical protein [Ottowia sp. VDI28]|uniref:hypothetical protein n=1 Tax=Ottowia sp. VDI28 TaxID=3133968 RepID=UPI003C2BB9D8